MAGLVSSWPRWMSRVRSVVMGLPQRQQVVTPGMYLAMR
jgi:hypothetical protein